MSYPINYPTPQGANIQIFRDPLTTYYWVKPQGASFVWFTLIGAGGGGSVGDNSGGGSGAVTNFMGPAFLMPDVLTVTVGRGRSGKIDGTASTVGYQLKTSSEYTLLTANGGGAGGNAAATATASNYFSAMGFYQSVAGTTPTTVTESSTTFLSSGGFEGSGVTSNYGYSLASGSTARSGFFMTQPIIVGVGGRSGSSTSEPGDGGVGCGGAANTSGGTGKGGDGLVVIITW